MALVIPADLRSYQSARPHDDVQGRHRGHRVSVLGTAFNGGGREFHFFYCADDDQLVVYRPPRQTGYTGIEYGTADSLFQRPGATHAGHTITRVGSYVRPNVGVEHVWFCQVDAKVLRQAVPGAVTPTLDLDFTQGVVDPRITFTRGSLGSIVGRDGRVQVLGPNAPRVDWHPVTGECLGLLVEEARANLLLNSENFGAWSPIDTPVITANADVAPDGRRTATQIRDDNSGAAEGVGQSVAVANDSLMRVFSIFIKKTVGAKVYPIVRLRYAQGTTPLDYRVKLDTNTGVVLGVRGTGVISGVADAGAYWRVWVGGANNGTGNTSAVAEVWPAAHTSTSEDTGIAGTATGSQIVWGAQLEQGTFPTSYIPTTTAAVTRQRDSADLTAIGHLLSSAGTLYADADQVGDNRNFERYTAVLDDGTLDNRLAIFADNGASPPAAAFLVVGGVLQASLVGPEWVTGRRRLAFAYAPNDVAFAHEGVLVGTDTSAATPTGLNRLRIGQSGGLQICGYIRRIAYWPKRLDNAALQHLSRS